jgi:ABC-type bacteriocin/lantibiotic exporter with double-glycine peptidase domain
VDELVRIMGKPDSIGGYSLEQLRSAAENVGIHAVPVEATLEDLERIKGEFVPIAATGFHFVVVPYWDSKRVVIIDPPSEHEVSRDIFDTTSERSWLLISKDPLDLTGFAKPKSVGWNRWIVAAFVLSLAALVTLVVFLMNRRNRK